MCIAKALHENHMTIAHAGFVQVVTTTLSLAIVNTYNVITDVTIIDVITDLISTLFLGQFIGICKKEAQNGVKTGMGVCKTRMGVCKTGMGVCKTRMGVCKTRMGVCKTGIGNGAKVQYYKIQYKSTILFVPVSFSQKADHFMFQQHDSGCVPYAVYQHWHYTKYCYYERQME